MTNKFQLQGSTPSCSPWPYRNQERASLSGIPDQITHDHVHNYDQAQMGLVNTEGEASCISHYKGRSPGTNFLILESNGSVRGSQGLTYKLTLIYSCIIWIFKFITCLHIRLLTTIKTMEAKRKTAIIPMTHMMISGWATRGQSWVFWIVLAFTLYEYLGEL